MVAGVQITNAMLYTAIDHHKKYSVACTLDQSGKEVAGDRIEVLRAELTSQFWPNCSRKNRPKRAKAVVRPACFCEKIGTTTEMADKKCIFYDESAAHDPKNGLALLPS